MGQNVPKYGTFLPVSMSHLIIVMSHLVIYNEFEHIFCPQMTFYYTCYEIHARDVICFYPHLVYHKK